MTKQWALVLVAAFGLVSARPEAQSSPRAELSAAAFVAQATARYRFVEGIPYLTASGTDLKLDVYTPQDRPGPHPTVIYIHGGGWRAGSRPGAALRVLPYLDMGFSVVNISYRLTPVALAPAAVEDARCALRWVVKNAKTYAFDVNKIVVTGHSAGGHLALTTGFLPGGGELDRACLGPEEPKVAAIVNWFGITDVADLLEGANQKVYAVQWLAGLRDRREIARETSPLTYVRAGLPPVLTIHGDADPVVPYSHATRLRDALTKVGSPNELVTVPGGGHGTFTAEQMVPLHAALRMFLAKYALMPTPVHAGH